MVLARERQSLNCKRKYTVFIINVFVLICTRDFIQLWRFLGSNKLRCNGSALLRFASRSFWVSRCGCGCRCRCSTFGKWKPSTELIEIFYSRTTLTLFSSTIRTLIAQCGFVRFQKWSKSDNFSGIHRWY